MFQKPEDIYKGLYEAFAGARHYSTLYLKVRYNRVRHNEIILSSNYTPRTIFDKRMRKG